MARRKFKPSKNLLHHIPVAEDHLEVQVAFQEFTDNSVSKTVKQGP